MNKVNNQPNVIFILSDQHSAKVTGFNNHPSIKTPNLDNMAIRGVCFDNAITQNPICTPSRVSWLSGQYCHNHGYYGLDGPHPDGLPTILGHFRKNGYKTAAIGKIHCPEYWVEDDCDTFLEARNCSIGGSPEYKEHLNQLGYDIDPDGYRSPIEGQCLDGKPSVLSYMDSQERFIVKKTIDFMNTSIDDDKPFIIHTSFGKPHQPYIPAREFWDLYKDEDIELPVNFSYDLEKGKKAPHLIKQANENIDGRWTLFEPRTHIEGAKRKMHGYYGCVSQVDHAIGEILDYLRENNLEENTIVIYSTDHGDYVCEHGIMEKAPGICSDTVTRIPYLWVWPGQFKEGHKAEEIVETVDLANTLCNLCGIEHLESSDGRDLSPLLFGGTGEIHKIGVTEFPLSKSVRKGKYRLVFYSKDMFEDVYPDGFGELYDLEADPFEMKNLYFDQVYEKIVLELERDLTDWLLTSTRPKTVLRGSEHRSNQQQIRYRNSFNADGKIDPKRIVRGTNYA